MNNSALKNIINPIMFIYILGLFIFTYRPGYNVISNLSAIFLIIAIWMSIIIARKKVIFNTYIILQLIFIVICMFSSLYAIKTNTSISKVLTLLFLFAVTFSLVNYIDTLEKVETILSYIMYSGVITCLYILAISDFSQVTRFGGEFGNVNSIGLSIAASAIICFSRIVSKKKYKYIVFLLLMITCILLTGSRKALLLVVASFLLIAFLRNKNSISKIIKFILITVCLLLVFAYLIFEIPIFYQIIGRRFENLFDFIGGKGTNEGSINIRYNMTKIGIDFFKEKPILGYGIDNYRYLYAGTYSHNNAVELMVGTGIFGFLVYYLMQLTVLKDLIKMLKDQRLRNITHIFITILLSYILMTPGLIYYYDKIYGVLISIAGAACIIYKKENMGEL